MGAETNAYLAEARALLERLESQTGGGRGGEPDLRRRDRRRRARALLRHRPLAHPGRGAVPALRLVPRLRAARRAVDDVPHAGRRRERPAAGDGDRARRGLRGEHPRQLPPAPDRRRDGVQRGGTTAVPIEMAMAFRAAGLARDRGDVGRALARRAGAALLGHAAARPRGRRARPVHAAGRRARRGGRRRASARARRSRRSRSRTRSRCGRPSCSRSAARCRRCSRPRRSSAPRSRARLFDAAYAEHARRYAQVLRTEP